MKTLAFIIDGVIEEVLVYDERMAAILMSNPTVIDISKNHVSKEWAFDGENFKAIIDGEEVSIPADRIVE